tara:strand:+ start:234 stop:1163 length:930 start_codon:yes stop_codon:yes gene_type:complete
MRKLLAPIIVLPLLGIAFLISSACTQPAPDTSQETSGAEAPQEKEPTRLEEQPEKDTLAGFIPNKAILVEMDDQKVWFDFRNNGSVTIEDESGDTTPMQYTVRGLRVTFSKGAEELAFTSLTPQVSAGDKLTLYIGTDTEGAEAHVIEVIPTRYLTKKEATDLIATDIGKWKVTGTQVHGTHLPGGGTPERVEDISEVNWDVEGQSISVKFNPLINGKKVPFVGHKEYDANEGVFIWRAKGEGFPETVSRERYNPEKRIFHSQVTHQNGAKETSTYEIIDENKRLYKTQLKQDGEVVFTMKLTFTRITE